MVEKLTKIVEESELKNGEKFDLKIDEKNKIVTIGVNYNLLNELRQNNHNITFNRGGYVINLSYEDGRTPEQIIDR
ncbi:MAG: hypothetical protein PHF86_06910 [Candidatus Nanoarchaeia archaeon]|nr:hypothetical protein [Candidatus Nanoarchaeia archaeon]